MNFRGVKPVGVAQKRFVQVPLVEWCSLMRVVNPIDNPQFTVDNSIQTPLNKEWDLNKSLCATPTGFTPLKFISQLSLSS